MFHSGHNLTSVYLPGIVCVADLEKLCESCLG